MHCAAVSSLRHVCVNGSNRCEWAENEHRGLAETMGTVTERVSTDFFRNIAPVLHAYY